MNSKELRQRRAELVAEMNKITAAGNWTPELREKWEKVDKDQEQLRVQIEAVEKSEQLATEMNSVDPAKRNQPQPGAAERASITHETRVTRENFAEVRASDAYKEEFRAFLRSGQRSRMLEEVRTYSPLDNVTGADGAYLIPTGFQRELEIKLKAYGGMRRNARVITTTMGNTLQWPSMDDTANAGEWLAVNTATSQLNPTFGQVTFTSNLASSKQVLVPVQLMQDSAFDIESELQDAFAIRLARTLNLGYTLGTGSGQPNGLVGGITTTLTAVGSSGNTGGAETGGTSIGTDDLTGLIAKVDPAYRVGASFMAHWSTLDALRKLRDKYGRPLWEVSMASGTPDKIYGYPYDWNADMATIALNAKTVIFGNFSKYVIRDVLGITMVRFNELFMSSYQIGFQAYLRTDGQVLQPAAFALLVQAAS